MTIHVTLLDEAGQPFAAGLGVELLRGGQVAATAVTIEGGAVLFEADPAGPYNLRLAAPDSLVTPTGPVARPAGGVPAPAVAPVEALAPVEARAPAAADVVPAAPAAPPRTPTTPKTPPAASPVPASDVVSELLDLARALAWVTARAAIGGGSSEGALRTTRAALSSLLARPEERAALRAVGADLAARVRDTAAHTVPGGAEQRWLASAAVAAVLLSADSIEAAARELDGLLAWALALAPWLDEATVRGALSDGPTRPA